MAALDGDHEDWRESWRHTLYLGWLYGGCQGSLTSFYRKAGLLDKPVEISVEEQIAKAERIRKVDQSRGHETI